MAISTFTLTSKATVNDARYKVSRIVKLVEIMLYSRPYLGMIIRPSWKNAKFLTHFFKFLTHIFKFLTHFFKFLPQY